MITADTSVTALAATISQALNNAGIQAVLSGGAAVQIYSNGRYVSKDLDFVTSGRQPELAAVLKLLGFAPTSSRRLFCSPDTSYLVEFPAWPLAVGDELLRNWAHLQTPHGVLQILTPTQCVQDRLAAFFHWRDPQSLEQAVEVAVHQPIDLDAIRDWAAREKASASFRVFEKRLETRHR